MLQFEIEKEPLKPFVLEFTLTRLISVKSWLDKIGIVELDHLKSDKMGTLQDFEEGEGGLGSFIVTLFHLWSRMFSLS